MTLRNPWFCFQLFPNCSQEVSKVGSIEKRGRRYRAKYRDPLGGQRSKTFTLKADAERFVREMEVDIERGAWLDPRSAEIPLAKWASDFLALARRLSPTT